MKLRKVSGCEDGFCPTVYVSDRGTGVAQGAPVVEAEGLALGPGEVAVELPLDVLKDALRALQVEGKL
ncbi:hypothetical protein JOF56_001075 [Kibdelosporangium banguiense]|uniref:DUF397 domain-containing protein n=1 Tax=Kibdelosporangium banguiense TaxID=1365924 RepID=A0ABS4T9C3_9PSEU|nr:hypothetical protein [Kibdelosporangium banguiense]MBP2320690.1 hypothetical protein [Kibdelosporangium banguiense]